MNFSRARHVPNKIKSLITSSRNLITDRISVVSYLHPYANIRGYRLLMRNYSLHERTTHSIFSFYWEVGGGQKQGASLSAAAGTTEEKKVVATPSRQMKPMNGAKRLKCRRMVTIKFRIVILP